MKMSRKDSIFKQICDEAAVDLNKGEIELFLPHRRNAMKIDGAYYDPKNPDTIIVFKRVEKDDPDLDGHYPERPILPAWCMGECANLGAALLGILKYHAEGLPMSGGISIGAPKRTVEPGEIFFVEVRLESEEDNLYLFSAEGYKNVQQRRKKVVTVALKGKLK